jgi:Asp-tRNA(Asn)/Glu-tRNA(Gln) amidotransferase A subunit family amidase
MLVRIEQLNLRLNAFRTIYADYAEAAREAAKQAEAAVMRGDEPGRLHGIPISAKDLVPTRGSSHHIRLECG